MNTNDRENSTNINDEADSFSGVIGICIKAGKIAGPLIVKTFTKPNVTVIAIDENNKPVKDVIVVLGDRNESTTASGKTIFEDMKPGKYTISVKYRDKEEHNIDVIYLESGDRQTIFVTLHNNKFFPEQDAKQLKSQSDLVNVGQSSNVQIPATMPSQARKITIGELLDLVKREMTDWDIYFSSKDEESLYWTTNSNESYIFISFEVSEDDDNNIFVCIGLMNEHPKINKFKESKALYSDLNNPDFFSTKWEWAENQSVMNYYTTVRIDELSNKISWLREGLVQWHKFLGIKGIMLKIS